MKIPVFIPAAMILFSCTGQQYQHLDSGANALLSKMQKTVNDGKIMYGHEDALLYGHSWCSPDRQDYDRSDVKDVCGDHPAVLGLDLGGIEHGDSNNLDLQSFDSVRDAAAAHFGRGGHVTFSWHADNPLTGGDSWDVSSSDVVGSILPGGQKHDEFMIWLSNLASFFDSLRDASGRRIPVIFRPWHEHTGSWFWWGRNLCTAEQYKSLWIMTHDYLAGERGLKNLIWAYSPNTGVDAAGYMERYPGDEYVDIIGRDLYGKTAEECAEEFKALTALYGDRMIALTECGYYVDSNDASKNAPIGNIEAQWNNGAAWSWFMPWYGNAGEGTEARPHADKAWWEAAFQSENVLDREAVKEAVSKL